MAKAFIRVPSTGKVYEFATDLKLVKDQEVLVENEAITEVGIVVGKQESAESTTGQVLRPVSKEDHQTLCQLKKKARHFLLEAQKKSFRHGLNMKILDADLSFDEKKLTFYFSSDVRVDFRSLVSDMVRTFNKLIRLQQVGARDEARYFGGIGKCGRELCCSKFLNNLESITLEMAQVQEMSTAGSAKLSGCCGKLMCCLAFEAQNYEDVKKKMPKIGSQFSNTQGEGKVVGHNILEGKVILENTKGKRSEVLM